MQNNTSDKALNGGNKAAKIMQHSNGIEFTQQSILVTYKERSANTFAYAVG